MGERHLPQPINGAEEYLAELLAELVSFRVQLAKLMKAMTGTESSVISAPEKLAREPEAPAAAPIGSVGKGQGTAAGRGKR